MPTELNSKQALQELVLGNARFVADLPNHPHSSVQHRSALVNGQNPIAAVLSCSDSRLPPEVIFDQGLGDIFVIRVAGNVASNSHILASIEYAVEHLGVPLLLVLGHQKCGAVTGAVQGGEVLGYIGELMQAIAPAVSQARNLGYGDEVENAIRANVNLTLKQILSDSKIVTHAMDRGALKLVGAYYSLETGQVTMISGTK